MKKIRNILFRNVFFAAVLSVLLFVSLFSAIAQNTVAKPTAAEWQADLLFMAERMPKQHPNLFSRMKKEDFDAAVKQFYDRIPSLGEDEIIVGLMKITAMVKDGHTSLFPRNYFRSGIFPVRFYLYQDGLFVQKAAPEYGELVGSRVLRIGNLSAEEALKSAGQLVSADNEMSTKEYAPILLSIPEILAGLKINDNKETLNLAVDMGGKEKTFQIKTAATVHELLQPPANWTDASAKAQPALYLKDTGNLYWFEYLKDQKLVYVQQNAVQNKPDEPVGAFYKRVFDFVAANPVEKFVLDLRNNDGGNNGLNRQVVIDIIKSKIDERGKLFVITGRRTFSAAQNFVNELEKYTNAIFVGEPTAGRPNHFGDNRPITLPNSKLDVRVSTLSWQDMDPRDTRPFTAPEIAVEPTSEDYRNGRDAALKAVFEYVPGSSFQEMITTAATQKDIADFARQYKAFKADPKHRFVQTEAALNRLGYQFLQNQRVSDAVEVFKLNVESYPNSANVYDSLGDGYQAAGKKEEAIKSYEKALSIDPNYSSSIESLKKLKGQ